MNAIGTLADAPALAPPAGDEEPLFEVVDGTRVEIPHMGAYATLIASQLMGHLFVQGKERGHAVTEVLCRLALPVDRNRRPDAAFVSFERWPKDRPLDKDANAWDVVPDLAVEVVSPHDDAEDLLTKVDEYFRAGVRLVWVIYPKLALVYVYEALTQVRGLTRADVLEGGPVLPGFRLPLAELFREP